MTGTPAGHAALIDVVSQQYALDLAGIHGLPHWLRVRENGLLLAERTGADPLVVELFAWLHDSRRLNDGWDRGHGPRAAAFARELRGHVLDLDDARFELLENACRYHADGLTTGDPTVLTCWDADRLDLGRVGIRPDPRYLCTPAACDADVILWAYRRSIE
jgi:uncharacterized protein